MMVESSDIVFEDEGQKLIFSMSLSSYLSYWLITQVGRLFDEIVNAAEDLEFTVKVSYFEIYMERVRDLFNGMSWLFLFFLYCSIFEYNQAVTKS